MDIFRESVIIGNDAIFKCSAPSFVSDFVSVDSWVDSEGNVLNSGLSGNSSWKLHSLSLGLRNIKLFCMNIIISFAKFNIFSNKSAL